jgi:DNA (cytosine-5)-methyltransferase 1
VPTVVDLFSGCGGLTQGFVHGGFTTVAAVELDATAAATYAANFGEDHVHAVDIADFRDVPEADVVIGGPPCQGFSNLGTKDPADPRNKLWQEYVRVVLAANPQVFVLENVERFFRSPEFRLLLDELDHGRLRAWRWHTAAVLNAADYGVPQRRQRMIVLASRVGPIEVPPPSCARSGWRTVRNAIGHVPFEPVSVDLPAVRVDLLGRRLRGPFKMTEVHVGRRPQPISLERYQHIPPGGGRFDLPDRLLPPCWAKKRTGTTDVMGRMLWDAPSLTIRTEFFKPEKGQYLHPECHRPITHREAALLQTFPESFVWCGSKTDIARQIGNAVPPRLAQSLAAAVAARLR